MKYDILKLFIAAREYQGANGFDLTIRKLMEIWKINSTSYVRSRLLEMEELEWIKTEYHYGTKVYRANLVYPEKGNSSWKKGE